MVDVRWLFAVVIILESTIEEYAMLNVSSLLKLN